MKTNEAFGVGHHLLLIGCSQAMVSDTLGLVDRYDQIERAALCEGAACRCRDFNTLYSAMHLLSHDYIEAR